MKREIWLGDGEHQRRDSLYAAVEIVKEYAKTDQKDGSVENVLERVYSKLEELRIKKES